MNGVDLLPGAHRARSRRIRPSAPRVGAALPLAVGVLAVAALGGLGYMAHDARGESERLDDEIAVITQRRAVVQAELQDFRAAGAAAELQRARNGAVVALVRGRVDWQRLIRDTATAIPEGVWLTNLTTDSGAAATPAADGATETGGGTPPAVRIDGVALSQPHVARMLVRLGSVVGLGEPVLGSSVADDSGGEELVRFTLAVQVDQRAQGRAVLVPVTTEQAGTRP